MKEKEHLIPELISGLICFTILLIISDAEGFSEWLWESVLSVLISLFFLTPLVMIFAEWKKPKEITLMLTIGLALLIFDIVMSGKTPIEVTISILQMFVIVTLISLFAKWIYMTFSEVVPP